VSLIDQLSAGLHEAQRAIAALGPRPKGDPAALRALAQTIRQEADTVATAGRLESSIPAALVFEGPAARRFGANAGDVAESLFVAQRLLDQAADTILREAGEIAEAQAAHDRAHEGLLGRIADLGRRLRSAPP